MKWLHICILYSAAVFILGCLVYSFIKPKKLPVEKSIRLLLFFAAAALGANATATYMTTRISASLIYGLYNSFIDATVISLLMYVREYTGLKSKFKWEMHTIGIAAAIDVIFMMINPWCNLVYHCILTYDSIGSDFYRVTQRGILYPYHIAFVYLNMFLVLSTLFRKMSSTPKIYKVKYAMITTMLCVIIGLHAAYLNFSFMFDYSLMFYAVIAFSIFYFTLFYVPRGLMERLLFFTVANMKDGIICIDIEGKCVHANRPAKIYCDAEGDPALIEEQVKKLFKENLSDNPTEASWRSVQRIDGQTRYYSIEYKSIFDNKGQYLGCFFLIHDGTEETNKLAVEKYRATHDALTGIYNKEYFYESSAEIMKSNPDTKFVIICTDVKNFKIVNDIFGVETGDILLKKIADSLAVIASENCVYGRLTGDRFAICMPREHFSERVLLSESLKLSEFTENPLFKVHLHFGVYEVKDINLRVSVMCDRANLAIKTIKDSYQNVVAYYDNSIRESFMGEQKIISEFGEALNTGQFQAYIQPQVSKDGNICGGEALVRWLHPEDGMIPPYKFIETFEQTGLISRLDAHMWELACIQLRKWKKEGRQNYYISVNISQKDFYLIDVYKTITSLVKKYNVPPRSLHLEITETAVMNNPAAKLELIRKLRDYGFIIEIDDFGSGYSSLNTLKDLCVDVLKIDMGFLGNTGDRARSKVILQMIISLAKSLNMEVITEGVETKEQVDFLTRYGCDIFQGYYFAKPMPIEEFEKNFLNKNINKTVN